MKHFHDVTYGKTYFQFTFVSKSSSSIVDILQTLNSIYENNCMFDIDIFFKLALYISIYV